MLVLEKNEQRRICRRIHTRGITAAALLFSLAIPVPSQGAGAFPETSGRVEIRQTVQNGFVHPGVGPTKANLETVRAMVLAEKEPWISYYREMASTPSASKSVTSGNRSKSDPEKVADDVFDDRGIQSRFKSDATKAYTQALMYVITGDEIYRANAMRIVRIWEQMDPDAYKPYPDCHIHSGPPLCRMVTAAEILRYTDSPSKEWAWTDDDTEDFTGNLIIPAIETFQNDNSKFMNQNNFSIMGSMAGFIFSNNREGFEQRVEWFTVNKTAQDQGFNGSIKQLFRLVEEDTGTGKRLDEPVVQLVEMGRDQAHAGEDLLIACVLSRMMLSQGTKVDPVTGAVSEAPDAVGPYEFLDDRILAAADVFSRYMLGCDTPWVPVPYAINPDGTVRGIYWKISDSYRGRFQTLMYWDMYYYYTYVRGLNVAETASYYYEAFLRRNPIISYYRAEEFNAWERYDGGGDSYWLFIPPEAETEGNRLVPKPQVRERIEVEERYTALDSHSAPRKEDGISYIGMRATEAGSRVVLLNAAGPYRRPPSWPVGLRFRSDGEAVLQMGKEAGYKPYHTLILPDTGGEWRYIVYDMGLDHVSEGQLDRDYSAVFLTLYGDGTHVDIDHLLIDPQSEFSLLEFRGGGVDEQVIAFPGAPIQIDLSASNATGCGAVDLPIGAKLDSDTGLLVWQPEQAGSASFVVTASDEITVAAKRITITVAADRKAAMKAVVAPYDPDSDYVPATLEYFKRMGNAAQKQIDSSDDSAFYRCLGALQSAVDGLELLTPLLPDGSMDLSRIVTDSTVGASLELLLDGNNNTYPVYRLAEDMAYIFDFGPHFRVSVAEVAMQGRMNFVDRMAGSAAFGSNDGERWTRLTPDETQMIPGLSHITVKPSLLDSTFRYIKIQKVDPQPDVLGGRPGRLFEPSELRIYGRRHAL